ncbi:MAG: hypothetical protein GY828_00115 [Candidatus Gracilibacteria bacterium]|nr:hypothetical protein [Candidatus Gracilibacteria bacterium]
MIHKENYTLITFYKFVDVTDPKKEVEDHLLFCRDIGMKGRVYIGTEGISSTVTCNEGQLAAYKLYLANHELFNNPDDFDIKATKVDSHKFPRMAVKHRDEIVALGKKYSKNEIEEAGNRMSIEDFKDLVDNGNPDEYIILDMRNNHEYKLGHFKNAIPANTMNFRELENEIEDYKKQFGDKKVISYCTGGIRCEKSTVMLQKAGLKNTYQLDGGVVKYINTYNDGNWEGNLYVFDDRVSDFVGDENTHTTIGECNYTGEKTDNCENCRYSHCNARLIADKKEYKKHFGFCSQECADKAIDSGHVKHADFDTMKYKMERSKIKSHPELEDTIMGKIKTHLKNNLEGVTFNHKNSQKEDCIID